MPPHSYRNIYAMEQSLLSATSRAQHLLFMFAVSLSTLFGISFSVASNGRMVVSDELERVCKDTDPITN